MTDLLVDKTLFDALVASARAPEVTSAPIVVAPEEEGIVVDAPGRPVLCWGAKVSPTFRERVWWIGEEITRRQEGKFDPNWLMACMAWETGEEFTASVKNMAGSGATGLIQFMPTTAAELAAYRKTTLTTASLAAMTAEDQLNWVYWYFRLQIDRHGAITNLEDCYMAILWPSAIGSPVSSALWTKAKSPKTYSQNAGLDSNKDGTITKAEAAGHVREKLTKGMAYAA